MKKKILALAAMGLFVAASPAIAADEGLYMLLSVGQSKADIDTGSIDKKLENKGYTGFSSSSDKTDTAYKVQLGYQFNPHFAVEGGFTDLGNYGYDARYDQGRVGASFSSEGWNVNALGIVPLNEDFSVFGKLGAIYATTKTHYKLIDLTTNASSSDRGEHTHLMLGLGLSWQFARQAALRLEFEHVDGLKSGQWKADAQLISLGVSYKF